MGRRPAVIPAPAPSAPIQVGAPGCRFLRRAVVSYESHLLLCRGITASALGLPPPSSLSSPAPSPHAPGRCSSDRWSAPSYRLIEQLREVFVREALELYRVIKGHTPDPLPLRCLEHQRMEAQVHTERAVPLPRGQEGPVPLPGSGATNVRCGWFIVLYRVRTCRARTARQSRRHRRGGPVPAAGRCRGPDADRAGAGKAAAVGARSGAGLLI